MRPIRSEEIVELADQARSSGELRRDVLALLDREIGFEVGAFQDFRPDAVVDGQGMVDFEPSYLEIIRANFHRYYDELAAMLSEIRRAGVGSLSATYSSAERDKLGLFRDVHRPNGVRSDLQCLIPVAPGVTSALCIGRRRRPFRDADRQRLVHAVPALALADAAVRYRSERRPVPPDVASELSPSERNLVDYVALGHTNRSIARALSISPLTVRNRLTRLYRRFGVASRAELVGLCMRRDQVQMHHRDRRPAVSTLESCSTRQRTQGGTSE